MWTDLATPELLAPLPEPRQMRDAMSFALHIRQSARGARALAARHSEGGERVPGRRWTSRSSELPAVYRKLPIYYITNRLTVVGPGATVKWPRYSEVMDYELEIGVVTRRTRAEHSREEAGAHIFGYTIFNDFSARDRQAIEMQGRLGPAKGKSFDGSNALGPGSSRPTISETLRRSKSKCGSTARRARRATPERCCFPSRSSSRTPRRTRRSMQGEFFGSGTVGNCCGLEIGRFLEDGDRIELRVDRIGVLSNRVVRQAAT